MERTLSSTYQIAASSVFGALSILFIFVPDIRLPWGMAVLDFIAVPWLIAFLMFGLKTGALTSLIGFMGIALLSEEPVPWIGATMKFSATIPLIVIPALLLKFSKSSYEGRVMMSKTTFIPLMALAILVRCLLTIFLNYFFAVPLLFGITPQEVPESFNWFFWGRAATGSELFYFVLGVSLWNTWQGIVDAGVAWFVTYLALSRGVQLAW
ncbi:MAG: hypothetical protein ACE5OY_01345 [Candidatus Bathyarchaeia archaeon]